MSEQGGKTQTSGLFRLPVKLSLEHYVQVGNEIGPCNLSPSQLLPSAADAVLARRSKGGRSNVPLGRSQSPSLNG